MHSINIIEEIFKTYEGPKFSVILWDQKERVYGKGVPANFSLIIKDSHTVQKLLSQGSIGFGESYMDGSLNIQGDIEEYLKLRHHFKRTKFSLSLAAAKLISSINFINNRKKQIAYHYDLSPKFFKLILDEESISYSAGMYKSAHTLDTAQSNKIDTICKWLDLEKNSSLLDLGSGWGGFAVYAAKKYKWKITGLTLSKAQLYYCNSLVAQENIKDKISFNYQDMFSSLPANIYDGAVMIESIEHAGKHKIPQFFRNVRGVLKKGAPFILQFTGTYEPKRSDRWTLKYVFPGGYLPTKDEISAAASDAGFKIEMVRDDTEDYIHTMSDWIKNLEKNQDIIEDMFDKRFYRLWYLWMHGAKVNFELGKMSLFRFKLLAK